jgi:anaerobic selenocysteine-containing dehydrogenase
MFVNPDDAAERNVADGDLVRVFNASRQFRRAGAREFEQRSRARCSCTTAGTR